MRDALRDTVSNGFVGVVSCGLLAWEMRAWCSGSSCLHPMIPSQLKANVVKKTLATALCAFSFVFSLCLGCGRTPNADVGADLGSQQATSPAVGDATQLTPGTTIVFADRQGPTIDWGLAPDKELYAEKSLLNQKAPQLFVESWIGEAPNTEGKFVLIDFWATWCPPCRKAIPELNALAAAFPEKLVVIGISDESAEDVLKMSQPAINYFSAIDTKGRTSEEIGIQGIPHVLLIDPSGTVAWQGYPLDEENGLTAVKIQAMMDKYLAGV